MENLPAISLPKQLSAEKGTIEGSVVPVVFGEVKVSGNILWMGNIDQIENKSKLARYGDATKAYIAEAWYAICMGFNFLLKIFANDKQLADGVDYDSAQMNEGQSSYAPEISAVSAAVVVANAGKVYLSYDKYIWTEAVIDTQNFNAVIYAKNQFMVVGNAGKVYVYDGTNWTSKLDLTWSAYAFKCICYGGDKYIAAVVSTDYKLLYSIDGQKWTSAKALSGIVINSIAYSGNIFVAVGGQLGGDAKVYYSYDGITWNDPVTPPPIGFNITLKSVCYSKKYGKFIAVGTAGNFTTSVDGSVWSSWIALGLKTYDLESVCEGADGQLFVIGSSNLPQAKIYRSTDGAGTFYTVYTIPVSVRSKIIWDGIAYYVSSNISTKIDTSQTGTPGTWSTYDAAGSPGYTAANDMASAALQNFEFVTKLRGIAHIFFGRMVGDENQDQRIVLNSDNKTPDMKFVVQNLATELPSGALYKYAPDGVTPIKFVGMNPAVVVWDILFNRQWGLSVPSELITVPQAAIDIFTSAAAKASNRIYGINLILDQLTSAKEVLDKIRDMTDIYCSMDFSTGQITIKSMYGDFAKVATLTDDDLKDCSIKIQTWEELYNDFEGEYIEPLLNYAKRSIYVKNDSAIELAGGITKKKKIDLTYFIDQDIASVRLNEIMQRESRPRITISCASSHILAMVNPGDTVELDSDEYSISGLFTVVQKSVGENNDLTVNIDLQERYYDLFDLNSKSVMASLGTLPTYQGTPTKTQLFFPRFKSKSELTTKIITAKTKVAFTAGQGINENAKNSGVLTYGTDYTIFNSGADYAIVLKDTWLGAVVFNTLGLLSVDVWD